MKMIWCCNLIIYLSFISLIISHTLLANNWIQFQYMCILLTLQLCLKRVLTCAMKVYDPVHFLGAYVKSGKLFYCAKSRIKQIAAMER